MNDNKIFKETFSVITASEDTLLEVMKVTVNRKRTGRISRIALVAAAVILVLSMATVAMAYVGFTQYENPGAMLRAFFGQNVENRSEGIMEYDEDGNLGKNLPGWERVPVDEELADDLITDHISGEVVSMSWEGYTLTVEAILYDTLTRGILLYYTVENPSGISGYGVEANGHFGWTLEVGNIFTSIALPGRTYIDETSSTDTMLYICEYLINWNYTDTPSSLEIEVGTYILDPEPFNENDNTLRDVQGTLTLQLPESGAMAALELSDGNVLISPIGIVIYEKALGFDPAWYIHEIILRFDDGSEYVLLSNENFIDNRMYALGTDAGDASIPYNTTHLFNRIVDINNLIEIILDDVVIRVK